MLNLLLTLFMMVKTEPKIELQKVQQPIMVEQRQETIGWVWYTQRPLDARTQTKNRYLDSVYFSWSTNILDDDYWYIIPSTKINTNWNLNRKIDWNKMICPSYSTYIIQWRIEIIPSWWVDAALFGVVIEKTSKTLTDSPIFTNYVYMVWWLTTIPFNVVTNLEPWWYIRVYGYNWETTTNQFDLYTDIIKFS